jgi:hypothetical protein
MDLFSVFIFASLATSGAVLGQEVTDQWIVPDLDGKSGLDNLVRLIYNSNNGSWDPEHLNLTELQIGIHDKLSTMDLTSTDLDALLNFDHVAVTPLGQLTAWVGDLFYPFLIYGLVLGAVVVLFFVGSQVKIWHKSRGRGFPCYD